MVVARMDTGSNSYLTLACVAGFLGFRGGERRGNWGREGRNRVKNVVLKV